jgi:radical SAM superfamily enzyme YgiQ (UPF0313 family)
MSIVLATINAGYAHTAFGLRQLRANMAELREETRLLEFTRRHDEASILDAILASNPRIVGLSVYIWNVERLTELVKALKVRRPEVVVVIGGPEVSHATDGQAIVAATDYVICGEGDLAFVDLCRQLLSGTAPAERVLHPSLPKLSDLADPTSEFSDDDIAHRILYVETSRGCPFRCEYCLSSLDEQVRFFPLDRVLASLDSLLTRGGMRFKFIDRTFNLDVDRCVAILEFFLSRWRDGSRIQFEVVPSHMPPRLREVISRFPPDTLRLEVGVQTFDSEVLSLIQRRQDEDETHETLSFLCGETRAVVHADLIAGLPGEDLDGFALSFDSLFAYRPAELQVGILKRLRGVPIVRHDEVRGMVYRAQPPYDLLENHLISADDMVRVGHFSRYWERIWNSGRFIQTSPLILGSDPSPFRAFMRCSDSLYNRLKMTHSIALLTLVENLFIYLTKECAIPSTTAAPALAADYRGGSDQCLPRFLKTHLRE